MNKQIRDDFGEIICYECPSCKKRIDKRYGRCEKCEKEGVIYVAKVKSINPPLDKK